MFNELRTRQKALHANTTTRREHSSTFPENLAQSQTRTPAAPGCGRLPALGEMSASGLREFPPRAQSRSSRTGRWSVAPSKGQAGTSPAHPRSRRASPRPHPRGGSPECRVLPSPPETQSVLCLSADSRLGPTNLCVGPVPPGRSRRPATQRRLAVRSCRPRSATGTPPAPARRDRAPGQKPPPPAPARPHLRGPTQSTRGTAWTDPHLTSPSERSPLALPPRPQKRRPGEPRLGDAGDWPGSRAEVPRSPPPPPRGAFQIPDCRRPIASATLAPRASPRLSRAPPPRAAAATAAGTPLPSMSHWVSDATGPSAKRSSPIAIAFIWPPQHNQAPPRLADARGRPPIRGPVGLGAFRASPSPESAGLAGGSACANDRARSEERGWLGGSAPVAVFVLLPTWGSTQESRGQARREPALGGTRSPQEREAGWSGWREAAGGRASSWRE